MYWQIDIEPVEILAFEGKYPHVRGEDSGFSIMKGEPICR